MIAVATLMCHFLIFCCEEKWDEIYCINLSDDGFETGC